MTRAGLWVLWLPVRLPGLNELLDARAQVFGSKHSPHPGCSLSTSGTRLPNAYSKLKKKLTRDIGMLAKRAEVKPVGSGYWTYILVEPSRRRDPSNVISGAVKLVEDALQEAKLLANDGWGQVLGIQSYWFVGKRPGVVVVVSQAGVLSREEALGYKEDYG